MIKPWSITTTFRNPERLRDSLDVLKQLENSKWNKENQKKYQILLIQSRVYGYGETQFYNNLSQDMIDLIEEASKGISFEQAEQIFNAKNYVDPSMRGRQSMNVFQKFGFVAIENEKIKIKDLGKLLLKDDFDMGEIFFNSFLKWQKLTLGNRDYKDNSRYDIKPFIGTLHLINAVNQKELARHKKAKGISKKEFSLFVPTLVDFHNIDIYAGKIIALRDEQLGKSKKDQEEIYDVYKKQFIGEFLGSSNEIKIKKLLANLKDYGDNAIRYFRLTRYIYIRGNGFYVDLENRRSVELQSLLAYDNAQAKSFASKEKYINYMCDVSQPRLPWETLKKCREIIEKLVIEIQKYESRLKKENIEIKKFQEMKINETKDYIKKLTAYRRDLQNEEDCQQAQTTEKIERCVSSLESIYDFKDRPILLEKLSAFGLRALNDALKIQPNYPVGDDNEPTFTAPANTPDIECFYENFNAICEVTMLKNRDQWFNEGQPVMRHLRDFELKHKEKTSYCLFIAPKLHRDTINTFWSAVKAGYEGKMQKIVPITINEFVLILKALLRAKSANLPLEHTDIARLYDGIVDASISCENSTHWLKNTSNIISQWEDRIIAGE